MGHRTNEAVFTHGDPPAPWNPERLVSHRGAGPRADRAQQPAAGYLGQVASFAEGINESYDHRAKTVLEMGAAFFAVRGLQHWRQARRSRP